MYRLSGDQKGAAAPSVLTTGAAGRGRRDDSAKPAMAAIAIIVAATRARPCLRVMPDRTRCGTTRGGHREPSRGRSGSFSNSGPPADPDGGAGGWGGDTA